MGYRSDVAMRIEFDNPLALNRHIAVLRQKLDEIDSIEMFDGGHASIKDTELTLLYDDTKWYEGVFPEVDTIMEWFHALADAADEGRDEVKGAQYIRIGESTDDVEERYSGDLYNCMYIHRSIEL